MHDSDLHLSEDDSGEELYKFSSPDEEVNSDIEQPYERKPRIRETSWEPEGSETIPRLPIKLPDGRVVKTAGRVIPRAESESEDEAESSSQQRPQPHVVEDVSTGSRFGRPAVVNVIRSSSQQVRIQMAKEQIAGICQDILSDPESSVSVCVYSCPVYDSHTEQLGLLRRLHTFSLPKISLPQTETLIMNDPLIRRLAMVSQLAVFKDVIPGYRIRNLTEGEKAEKVSQMVARTREWEQGLVSAYQTYLRSLESELKGLVDVLLISSY